MSLFCLQIACWLVNELVNYSIYPRYRNQSRREAAEQPFLSAGVAVSMRMMTGLFDLITPRAFKCPNKSCNPVIHAKLLLSRDVVVDPEFFIQRSLLWSSEGRLMEMCVRVVALVPLITSASCLNYKVEVDAGKQDALSTVYTYHEKELISAWNFLWETASVIFIFLHISFPRNDSEPKKDIAEMNSFARHFYLK